LAKKHTHDKRLDDVAADSADAERERNKAYEKESARLQSWVQASGARIVIIFEGRDAAGKGGVIKRFVERVSQRVFRVVALPAPSDREKSQMYFHQYMAQLPAAGEVAIFDRSWYNCTGVERVMGFTSEDQVKRFLHVVPHLEGLIIESGVTLLKYFLDVSENEQERRFRQRIDDPVRQWKLSAMVLERYRRSWDYTKAYDEMIRATDSPHAPSASSDGGLAERVSGGLVRTVEGSPRFA
jgi:polyphosphate kinase